MYSYPQLASPYAFMLVRKRGAGARIVKEDQEPDGDIYFNKYQCNYTYIREYKINSNFGIKRFRTILNGFAAPNRYNKITYITIGESGIRDIRGISKLSALKSLSMRSQKIVNIPEEIKLLSDSIDHIMLNSGHIKCVNILGECKKLRHLELIVNRISIFPQSFVNLQNLQKLDLSYNNIECIPNIVMNVESLNISHNNLKDISILSSWNNLRYLYVSHNKISQIPVIDNIITLYADNNELSGDINLSFSSNRHNYIDEMDLSYNKITSFKCGWPVSQLRLSNNLLQHIPILQYGNGELESLNLDHNNITIEGILKLPCKYKHIYLHNNNIKGQICASICIASLKTLDLSYNRIRVFSSCCSCYCSSNGFKLTELYLNDNLLRQYNDIFLHETLIILDLKNNYLGNLSAIPSSYTLLRLDISNNNILLKDYYAPRSDNMTLIANGNRIENIHIDYNSKMTAIIDKKTAITSSSKRLSIIRI